MGKIINHYTASLILLVVAAAWTSIAIAETSVDDFTAIVNTGTVKQQTQGSGNQQDLNVGSATGTKANSFNANVTTGTITQSSSGSGIVQTSNIGSANASKVGTFNSTVTTGNIEQVSTKNGQRQELDIGSVTNSTVTGSANMKVNVSQGVTQTGSGEVVLGSVKNSNVQNFSTNLDVKGKVTGSNIKMGSIVGQSRYDNEGVYHGLEPNDIEDKDRHLNLPSKFNSISRQNSTDKINDIKNYVFKEAEDYLNSPIIRSQISGAVSDTKILVGFVQTTVAGIGSGGCGLIDLYVNIKLQQEPLLAKYYAPTFNTISQNLEYCNKLYGGISNKGFEIAWDGVNDFWSSEPPPKISDLKNAILDENIISVKQANQTALQEAVDGKPLTLQDYAISVVNIFGAEIGAAAFKVIDYGASRYIIYLTKTGKIQTVQKFVTTTGKALVNKIDGILVKVDEKLAQEISVFIENNSHSFVTQRIQKSTDDFFNTLKIDTMALNPIDDVTKHGFRDVDIIKATKILGDDKLLIKPTKEGRVHWLDLDLNEKSFTLKNKSSDFLDKYLSKDYQRMDMATFNDKINSTVVHYKPDLIESKKLIVTGPPKVYEYSYKLSPEVNKYAHYIAKTEGKDLATVQKELLERGTQRMKEFNAGLDPAEYRVNELNQVVLKYNNKAITSDIDGVALLDSKGNIKYDPAKMEQLAKAGFLTHKEIVSDWKISSLSEGVSRLDQIVGILKNSYIVDKEGLKSLPNLLP